MTSSQSMQPDRQARPRSRMIPGASLESRRSRRPNLEAQVASNFAHPEPMPDFVHFQSNFAETYLNIS